MSHVHHGRLDTLLVNSLSCAPGHNEYVAMKDNSLFRVSNHAHLLVLHCDPCPMLCDT